MPCCRCSSSRYFAALRGIREVAVAVLRGPPCPPWKKVLQLKFCSCSSSWSFAALRGQRCCSSAVEVLRVTSRPFAERREVAVLRGPPCPPWKKVLQFCSCSSSWPFAVLRGPSWTKRSCSCSSSRYFAPLRGKKEVAVLRGPPCPPWKKVLQLKFCSCRSSRPFMVLRGPSWTKRSCSCRSPRYFAPLRGKKEVAVAVLRGPPCPPWTKVLQLKFFAALRGPSRPFVDKKKLPFAVAVLRVTSRPFAEKGKLPLPFFAFLRGPSWIKRGLSCPSQS